MPGYGVRLTVAYDGTAFAGWAAQPGQRTVQGVLEGAISEMAGACSRLRAASRTDSGVHARGQIIAFDAEREIPPLGWVRGLTGALPEDVSVVHAEPCAPGYDPRADASGKHYRYLLWLAEARDPLLRRYAWHIGKSLARPRPARPPDGWLNLAAMREAASLLAGTHDFAAFRAAADPRADTVRTLRRVEVSTREPHGLVAIDVVGNAFLMNMVRIIAGTLVEVGRERLTPAEVAAALAGRNRPDAGPTAPAHGLTLMEVLLGRAAPGPAGC